MTYQEARQWAIELLEKAEIADAKNDAMLLLCEYAAISPTSFFLKKEEPVPPAVLSVYQEAVRKRESHIPLQYITGEQNFMGFPMKVTPDVLIPRFDTENLVEAAERLLTGKQETIRVLDLCTGSGCIIISLKKLCPFIDATGSDISGAAIRVAQENALRNEAQVTFVCSDLFQELTGPFDMIVSNPPYIPTKVVKGLASEVKDHEPMLALDGDEDGLLFYRRIIKEARPQLSDGGYILFEIGHDQAEEVTGLLKRAGYEEIRVKKDLAGRDRVVISRKG